MRPPGVYGLIAEFDNPDQLVQAAERAYAEGYRKLDAYSPLPIHGLAEAMGSEGTAVPKVVLVGGLTGCAFGYGLCYWMTVLSYPHNVGGRPLYSWPAYIPITFECTVLFAALSAVFGLFLMNGFPKPYHPVFNVARFVNASQDRFFLCIESIDRKFDVERTRDFLLSLSPTFVTEVPE